MTSHLSVRARPLIGYWLIAVSFQSIFAIVSASYPLSFGYGNKTVHLDSVKLYFDDARPIFEGRLPYRDYPVEYPVLAIPLFVAPLIAGMNFEVYKFAFFAEMLLLNAAAVWLVARQVAESEGIGKVPERLGCYSLAFGFLCPLMILRYDIAPMFLAFASAYGLAKGRTAGGMVAGLGVLVKLVPGLVLVPFLAMAGDWRPKARGLAAFALTVALGGLGWWWLGGDEMIRSFRFHSERGIQLESLYASAYMLSRQLAGVGLCPYFDHGAMNVWGPGSEDAAKLSPILQGALLLLVAGRAREAGKGHEMRFATAALLAYILAGKVLSPQYIVWLVPFVCVLPGATGSASRRVFLAICVLTAALYPYLNLELSFFSLVPVIVLTARNLGLAWLFAIQIRKIPAVDLGSQITLTDQIPRTGSGHADDVPEA